MFTLIKKSFLYITGKRRYQRFFEELLELSLKGLHIGEGGSINSSGELYVLKGLQKQQGIDSKLTIFDVGANIGNYSKMIKDIFKDKAKVFAFEPSKKTFQKLLQNTNHLSNITCFNFGFGNEETRLNLYSNKDESGLASVYKRKLDHFNIEMNLNELIELRTIDGFCRENKINHINLLKIDVEGHELKVLEGARNMLSSQKIDFIQFEFGGCNIDSKTYFQDFYYLLKDNYHIYRVLKDGIFKIEKYKETYEIFKTTNFLAIRISK